MLGSHVSIDVRMHIYIIVISSCLSFSIYETVLSAGLHIALTSAKSIHTPYNSDGCRLSGRQLLFEKNAAQLCTLGTKF